MIGKPGDREHPIIVGNPRPQEPFASVFLLNGSRIDFYGDPNAPVMPEKPGSDSAPDATKATDAE